MAFMDEIADPQIRELFRYWLVRRRRCGLPLRADIDPTSLPPDCLPHLYLYRLEPDGRLRYILIGTAVVKALGQDYTGRYVDEVLTGGAGRRRRRLYHRVIETARPLYYTGPSYAHEAERRRVARLVLPLSSNGRDCDHVFGIAKFGPPLQDALDEPWLTAENDPATIVFATDEDLACDNGAAEEVGQ